MDRPATTGLEASFGWQECSRVGALRRYALVRAKTPGEREVGGSLAQ